MTYNTENPETVTVKTWIARRTGGVFDGTVWVPEGRANAEAVRRPGNPSWAEISPSV